MQKLKQQQLFDQVFEKLPDHVTLLLIIVSGFLLAKLTWTMFPADPSISAPVQAEDEAPGSGVSVIRAHASSENLGDEIAKYHLLGVYKPPQPKPKPKPKPVKAKAPPPAPKKKPRVPMNLVGVYALSGQEGIAIINVRGKQEVVGLGEQIADTGAELVKIDASQVDVSWDEEIETLKLPNMDKSAIQAEGMPEAAAEGEAATGANQQESAGADDILGYLSAGQTASSAVRRTNAQATSRSAAVPASGNNNSAQAQAQRALVSGNSAANGQDRASSGSTGRVANTDDSGSQTTPKLGEFRQQVMNNNINLLKVVRPSPARENGQLIGFRVRPGTNQGLFQQTGLRSGDIVTAINGMPLTSNSASRQAMQSLSSSAGAILTVKRGSDTTTVQISF